MNVRLRIATAVGAAVMAAPVSLVASAAPGTPLPPATFSYTGAPQYVTIPAGVTSVAIEACGAEGGRYASSDPPIPGVTFGYGSGGRGGRAVRTLQVTPGEQLAIYVGGSGTSGGWNGGGTSDPNGGARGGGASDVRQGGTAFQNRRIVGGGGGGGGFYFSYPQGGPLDGGTGGGLTGSGSHPGTQTGPGIDPSSPTRNGALGVGGNGSDEFFGRTSGGGGGLYGGAAGSVGVGEGFQVNGASGGSGLGDTFYNGVCTGNGSVKLTYVDPTVPSILPSGVLAKEGRSGSVTWQLPVRLSAPSAQPVTVDWSTVVPVQAVGLAQPGSDFVGASGVVAFAPGQTEAFVPIEILGDTDPEAPLLWGEWGTVQFSNPTNARVDTGPFFGLGLFVIVDSI